VVERSHLSERIAAVVEGWVGDPQFPAESCEWVEERLAVRIVQASRDSTTVWINIGDRTVSFEAYFLPAPRQNIADVHRQLLVRNDRTRFVHFSTDQDGEIYLRSRLAVDWIDPDTLQSVFAEITELIDVAFRPLLGLGFSAQDG